MPDVTVLADDLTGAADCGIAFAVAGLPTFVAFGDAPPPDTQVMAVDLDTRRLAPGIAAECARSAARRAYAHGSRTLYKKIDSTLRGNVGPELAATFQVSAEASAGKRPLVVASPAFPGTRRTVRDGHVLVAGVPLGETEVWRGSGMTGPSDLPSMLRLAGLRPATVRLEAVRAGGGGLAAELAGVANAGTDVAVCDAEEEGDLASIARAGVATGLPIVWVGSAGLARHLPAALGLRRAPGRAPPRAPERDAPALFLVGSRSTVAREQAQRLASEPAVETLVAAPEVLLEGERGAGWAALAASLRSALATGRDVVLLTGIDKMVELDRGADLAAALGRLAAAHAGGLRGLVATGGDIARAALGALGASGLHLAGEVEAGVPLGVSDTTPPLAVITKAGAFGSPETLQRCRAALRRPAERT